MPRPVPKQEAEAYRIWAHEANRDISVVAERLRIPVTNVYRWRTVYRWQDRLLREVLPEQISNLRLAKYEASAGLVEAAHTMRAILAGNESARDKSNAARALVEVYKALSTFEPPELDLSVVDVPFTELDDGDGVVSDSGNASRAASRAIEANVTSTQRVMQRPKYRR